MILKSSRLRHCLRYSTTHIIAHIPVMGLRMFWYRQFFQIGRHSTIMMGFSVRDMRRIIIGQNANINSRCMFDSRGGKIEIGDFVDVSPEVNIWTLQHDPQDPDFGIKGGDVRIGDFVWIGNRAIILPDLSIGEGAVVAAGAVVTRDVEPWIIVAGVPARKIGDRVRNQNPRKPYRPFLL